MASGGKRAAKPSRPSRPRAAGRFVRLTGGQRLLLAGALLLGMLLLGTLLWKALFVRPEVPLPADTEDAEDGPPAVDYGDGVRPRAAGERKSQDYYTVLILGRDTGGGGNTDTMLLASYDVTNQRAAVMSIPRDTMVNVSWDVKKINSVYNAHGGGEAGIEGLYREIAQLVGFEPDFRVVVEWEAVGKIVDAIGGVDFDVPYDMDYHDEIQDLVIEQAAGYRHLTGEDAMEVIRWRANDNASPYGYHKRDGGVGDIGRMKIQQEFLKAVTRQMMTPANLLNIGPISKVFQENVETDLSVQNILWFGRAAFSGGLRLEDVDFFTMPWQTQNVYSRSESKRLGGYRELNYVLPRGEALLELVNGSLSPFLEPFTLRDLDIMSVNGDGSIRSSTGRVEDRQAALPPPGKSESASPEPEPPDTPPETPDTPESPPETPETTPPQAENPTEPPPSEGDGVSPEEDPGFSMVESPPEYSQTT